MAAPETTRADERMHRILLVDDHPLVQEGLCALIAEQPDMLVCARCTGVGEAMNEVRRTPRPDLAIIDISLRDGHGLDLVRRIRAFDNDIRILVFSMYDASLYAEVAFKTGATGYLHKHEERISTLTAVRETLRGRRVCSASDLGRGRAAPPRHTRAGPGAALSARELQVFHLLGEGHSTHQIARLLNLSQHTVDTHRENIKAKLGLRSSNELVRAAVEWISPGTNTAS